MYPRLEWSGESMKYSVPTLCMYSVQGTLEVCTVQYCAQVNDIIPPPSLFFFL